MIGPELEAHVAHRMAELRRRGPATIERLTKGRRYTVYGEPGMEYVGKGLLHGLHTFRGPRGSQAIEDGRLAELMATGKIVPEGPAG